VRLLVRAHDGLGKDAERLAVLRRAWSLQPDDLELALKLAVRLGEAGEGEERRALLADLLPRFAAESRNAGLEEAALEFVEHCDLDGLLRLIETLPRSLRRARSRSARSCSRSRSRRSPPRAWRAVPHRAAGGDLRARGGRTRRRRAVP
jgi:hypothetical protein